uniref:AlNc14C133G7026 protein n=1 Tax=Albugo laibachii Nc14 TaxID=890382 RepID=F0WKH6_9STRA|nr:AlNc14C133G7026 [Albugo laibachii Nc14]|eukprot:CCA21780.1 AlNc14C133G7026 [Albugo laibachii Nc14]
MGVDVANGSGPPNCTQCESNRFTASVGSQSCCTGTYQVELKTYLVTPIRVEHLNDGSTDHRVLMVIFHEKRS